MTNPRFTTADIFCKVIDNYGDIGVCWRLCKQLAKVGVSARLIVDDVSALAWMATPDELQTIEVMPWDQSHHIESAADLVIESFGCELPENYITKMAKIARQATLNKPSTWVNLEYLTAERYAEECHLLPSPVMQGVGRGLTKTFFYPGFTNKTGGLLREPDLLERQAKFDKAAWLKSQGIEWNNLRTERIVSLFCYEPAALATLIDELQNSEQPTLLLVTAGRSTQAMNELKVSSDKALRIHYLPYLTQDDYDHLLWASDFNFVRGEDSLVRAIWAGKPFVWQIYPQDDDAHHAKLKAFLDAYLANMTASIALHIRAVHHIWNGISKNAPASHMDIDLPAWRPASLMQSGLWAESPHLVETLIGLKQSIS